MSRIELTTVATMEKLQFFIPTLSEILQKDLDLIKFHNECRDSVYPRLKYAMKVLHVLNPAMTEPLSDADIHIENLVNQLTWIRYIPEVVSRDDFVKKWVQNVDTAYDLFIWLTRNRNKVRVRAYLASFVDQTSIPSDLTDDPTIQKAVQVNQELVHLFWQVYKDYKSAEKKLTTWQEVQADLRSMSHEATNLGKRAETQKGKLESVSGYENFLTLGKMIASCNYQRNKIDKEMQAREEEIKQIKRSCWKCNRLQFYDENVENIIASLKDTFNINNTYLTNSVKLEGDKVRQLNILFKESINRALENDDLIKRVKDLQESIKTQTSQKIAIHNAEDDKLGSFRKQAAGVANRKEILSEKVSITKNQHAAFLEELKDKENLLFKTVGGEVFHGEKLKRFIAELRGKSFVYKSKREQLQYWASELNLLNRTSDVLRAMDSAIRNVVRNPSPPEQSETTQTSLATIPIDEARQLVKKLLLDIESERVKASQAQSSLQAARKDFSGVSEKHEQVKETYDEATKTVANRIEDLKEKATSKNDQIEILERQWKTITRQFEKLEQVFTQLIDEVLEGRDSEGNFKPTYKEKLKTKMDDLKKESEELDELLRMGEIKKREILHQMGIYKELERVLVEKIEHS